MNVSNFSRAVAYLTLVYLINIPEDAKCEAARLPGAILYIYIYIYDLWSLFFLFWPPFMGPFINSTKRNEMDLVCT